MTNEMKKMKNDVLTNVHSAVSGLFDESKNAKDLIYESSSGISETERPGEYNKRLTRLMISDMRQLRLFTMGSDKEFSNSIERWANILKKNDIRIRRMFDDRKVDRPVEDFPYEDAMTVINEMSEAAKADKFKGLPFKDIEEKTKKWVTRLLKLDICAYYCKAHETLAEVLRIADTRAYDDNGELVYGLSEDDTKSIKIIAAMEQLLLKALIRIPAESDEVKPAMARIELIEALMKAIAEEDEELIDRLAKCAEAANDLEEADD